MANPNNPFAGMVDPNWSPDQGMGVQVSFTPPTPRLNETGLPTAAPQRSSPTDKPVLKPAPTADELIAQAQASFDQRKKQTIDAQVAAAQKAFEDRQTTNTPYANPATEFTRGFNRTLANLIGSPVELVDQGLRLAGTKLLDHPGDAMAAVREGFKDAGLDTTKTDSMLQKIGEGALNDTLTAAVMLAAAPEMAAYQGGNWAKLLLKSFGEFFTTKPGTAVGSWLTGGAGAVVGNEVSKGGGPIAEGLGTLVGSMIGGGTAFGPAKLGKWIKEPLDYARRAFSPVAGEPIKPQGIPGSAVRFATDQIAGDLQRVKSEIDTAIGSIPRTGAPEDVSSQAFSSLLKARDYSESIENVYWARVPKGTKVPQTVIRELEDDIAAIEKQALKVSPKTNPEDTVSEIRQLGASTRAVTDPNTGQVVRNGKPTDIERLLGLHSTIRAQIRADRVAAANGSKAVTQGQLANLEAIDTAVLDAVGKVLPDSVPLAQAREYTRLQAQMFKQGPVGRILSWRQTGEGQVLPEQVGQTLFNQPLGAERARQAEEFAARPPYPVSEADRSAANLHQPLAQGPTPAPGSPQPPAFDIMAFLDRTRPVEGDTPEILKSKQDMLKSALDQISGPDPTGGSFGVQQSLEDFIRSSFRQAGDEGVAQAQAFIDKNQSRIKYFANVADELNTVGKTIAALVDRQNQIETSALARMTGADPKVAIATIFTAKDPKASAEAIMKTMSTDPEALSGLRSGMIDWLFDTTGGDPRRITELLKPNSTTRGAFEKAFDPDKLARLDRAVTLANNAMKGGGFQLRKLISGPTVFAMKILGTMIGRSFNTGTIQVPGYMGTAFADAGRSMMMRVFNQYTPAQLLRNAVEDPKWEKFLYARVPSTPQEMKQWTINMRRMVYTYQAAEEMAKKKLGNTRK